jgi:hypothetical protein
MGAHCFERHAGRRTGFAVFAAMCCLAWGLSASAQAASPPSVFDESVSGITEHDATLEASINPNGLETSYRFRLESGCLPPRECLVITTYPLPSGKIPASSEAHPVSLDLNSAGVTLDPYTEYRYSLEVTSSGGTTEGPGHFFTTAPASAPSIQGESVSNITPTDATLQAQINSEGLETTYEVWVGALPCVVEEAGPERCEEDKIAGTIPAGFSAQQVSVDIAKASHELKPNSSYLYSFRATNMDGTTYGGNKEFKTAAASPPSIESVSVSNITPTDATLEATLNSEGLETSYEFQLLWHLCPPGTEPLGCEAMIQGVPLPSGKLFGSFVGQSISLELNSVGVSLHPHAEYDYRVVAGNAAGSAQEPPSHAYGSAEGGWQTLITPEDGVQPLNTTPSPGSDRRRTPGRAPLRRARPTLSVRSRHRPRRRS